MKNDKQMLMKHFSSVLRKRANAPSGQAKEVSLSLARYLSRKELIEILREFPKRPESGEPPILLEMENEELLELIGDDLFIISYFTSKWCRESIEQPEVPEKEEPTVKKEEKPSATTKPEAKPKPKTQKKDGKSHNRVS